MKYRNGIVPAKPNVIIDSKKKLWGYIPDQIGIVVVNLKYVPVHGFSIICLYANAYPLSSSPSLPEVSPDTNESRKRSYKSGENV